MYPCLWVKEEARPIARIQPRLRVVDTATSSYQQYSREGNSHTNSKQSAVDNNAHVCVVGEGGRSSNVVGEINS